MARKILPTYFRRIKRWARKQKVSTKFFALLFIGLAMLYAYDMNTRRLRVDPMSYLPLMSLIGDIESGDNYNAYFGSPKNNKIIFTNMTVEEVMKWQSDFIADGNPSSAVGRYQIISTTFEGLVRELDLDSKQKFDQKLQDRMAIALFERRGSIEYVNNELSAEEFAASLAKEWAALPKVTGDDPDSSYYANDGLNKSRTKPETVIGVITQLSAK